ncbi:MAG: polyprenyl synthetase family protein [Bacteroidales bacterium]|nr:polyprenyl synthetase family protein [Bacteroidales bacterium]
MYTFKECQDIIEKRLMEIKLPAEPASLYDPIHYVFGSEGKRIRPCLTLMACNLFTDSIEVSINPALAIELFHNFTLLHDDIMDNSELRRGRLTVHKKWNNNVAILSGDAMLIKAYDYLSQSPGSVLADLLSVFNQTALQVCEGQQYDMDFESEMEVTAADYLKMIELKTSVLIAASLKIGAICGKAGKMDSDLLYQFGRNLGIAFQLQDDLLDVYADPNVFGKSGGGDIVANKKTFLLMNALTLASGKTLAILTDWLGKKDFNKDEKIRAVTDIYNSLKINEITESKIVELFSKARLLLDKVSVEKERKKILEQFALQLMKREK